MSDNTCTCELLVELEPRLADLEQRARQWQAAGSDAYHGTGGSPVNLKADLEGLVGWHRADSQPSFPAEMAEEDAEDQARAAAWVAAAEGGPVPASRSGRFQDVARRRPYSRLSADLTQAAEQSDGKGLLWETCAWDVARRRILDILTG